MIRVIIKGNREHAEAECAKRGIPFTYTHASQMFPEVYGDVPNEYRDTLRLWFNEPRPLEFGKGYPIGTLLHYVLDTDTITKS